jgi:hypothetical protein
MEVVVACIMTLSQHLSEEIKETLSQEIKTLKQELNQDCLNMKQQC